MVLWQAVELMQACSAAHAGVSFGRKMGDAACRHHSCLELFFFIISYVMIFSCQKSPQCVTLKGRLVPSLESHSKECDSKECDSKELKSKKSDFVMFDIPRKY